MITLPNANLLVSFVISTHNRRDVLLNTLAQIERCGLSRDAFETLVVDNGSADGTADAVCQSFPRATLIREKKNRGSCAKNIALPNARGRYIVFLDDDSYPERGAVTQMIQHFERDPLLGAAVFSIHLADGSEECSAYPNVFIGAGTGFRKRALSEVGGLPNDFFMQAEEYDLSLRLLDARWKIERFNDLHVNHLKSPQARRPSRTIRLDVRNNFIVANRYFSDEWATAFSRDWLGRYYRLAKIKRQRWAFFLGAVQGAIAAAPLSNRRPLSDVAFESFAKIKSIESRLRIAQEKLDLQSILLIDLGKNILPFYLAAKKLGIEIVAIADETFAANPRSNYRNVPIVRDEDAQSMTFAAAILSNLSPVHAAQRKTRWRNRERFRPVIDLFEPGLPWDLQLSGAGPAESESRRTVARSA